MEIGKVHTWLQVALLVGSFVWGASKVDNRLANVEVKQESADKTISQLLTAVSAVENNQMSIARTFDDMSNNLLFHKFTDVDHVIVTDPTGTSVKLVISK